MALPAWLKRERGLLGWRRALRLTSRRVACTPPRGLTPASSNTFLRVSGAGALKGPLHGGANEAVQRMMAPLAAQGPGAAEAHVRGI